MSNKVYNLVKYMYETGNQSRMHELLPAVYESTQRHMNLALEAYNIAPSNSGAEFVGEMAGVAFSYREQYYDDKSLFDKEKVS